MEKGFAEANERQRKEQFQYFAMHATLRDGAGIAEKRRARVAGECSCCEALVASTFRHVSKTGFRV